MKWLKIGGVILSAVVITALGIDAADTLQGSRSTLLGQVISNGSGNTCPAGMVEVPMATSFTCVDIYEASAGEKCTYQNPSNDLETRENIANASCAAASEQDVQPWRFITREQAVTACMRAGKRLPENSEWYIVSVGTPDDQEACVTHGSLSPTGSHEKCLSAVGTYDTIGNVWEWVSDDVIEGEHQGRMLPQTGYVAQVDSNGVAVLTTDQSSELFYKDYFWSAPAGAFGMIRGGFYGSKDDAGVYSVHADTPPTTTGTAIGFRCVL